VLIENINDAKLIINYDLLILPGKITCMNTKPHTVSGSRYYGKSSIIVPLIGLGSLILIVCYFVFTAHDAEGQLWGEAIGFVLGGLILIVSTITGLIFAFISKRIEKSRSLFWTGLILNIVLLSLILYILVPFFLRCLR
jgi:hypothetical protein